MAAHRPSLRKVAPEKEVRPKHHRGSPDNAGGDFEQHRDVHLACPRHRCQWPIPWQMWLKHLKGYAAPLALRGLSGWMGEQSEFQKIWSSRHMAQLRISTTPGVENAQATPASNAEGKVRGRVSECALVHQPCRPMPENRVLADGAQLSPSIKRDRP